MLALALLGAAGSMGGGARPAFDLNDFGELPPSRPPKHPDKKRTQRQKAKARSRKMRKRSRGW